MGEVEGYYLRSKMAQSCLTPGWTSILQSAGNCTIPYHAGMTFNVVPMQAVNLPFEPGQPVEYLTTKTQTKLRGTIKNVQKDYSEEDIQAGFPTEGLLDIAYPDDTDLKTGAFFNQTRRLWSNQDDHQFFLRFKNKKKCLGV